MSDSLGHAQGSDGPQKSGTNPSSKKRPKITFIDPSEWANLQTTSSGPTKNEINRTLHQRLVDRQARVNRIEDLEPEPTGRRSRRKMKHQKSRRGRPRKRPIDPRRPWIESDDEEDDYIHPAEDDSDDEAFLERLAAEKEKEEAEERRRKREMQRLRQQKREERRYRATGRPGRPRTQVVVARLYANSNEDVQSSKASEFSDNEATALEDVIEEDQVEDIFDLPPPPSAEDAIMMEEGTDLNLEPAPGSDFPRISSIFSRRKAPPLILPPSRDAICPPQYLVEAVSIYEHLRRFGRLLKLSPFQLDDFLSAVMANENSGLLSAIHIALLKALIKEDENNGTHFCPPDCKDAVSLLFGYVLDQYTWPYILSLYLSSVKSGEVPALEALAHVGNTAALASSSAAGTLTASGGTDSVVTTSLFYDGDECVVPLDPSYPFVPISQRLAVLRGLVGLFLGTGAVRADVLREGMMAHDDFCRVCRLSGELLCCATCPAVFHLTCLTPPLDSVPQSQWWCPLCVEEQEMYGDKKIPKSRGEAKILPLGYDRAGRVYWHLEGRLFVEPTDFAQREPRLPGLMEGIRDEEWEKLEADDPTDDLEDVEDTNSEGDQIVKEEEEKAPEDSTFTDPYMAYANEPPVYYYSSLESICSVRQHLSTKWERGLCANFDNLIAQLEKSKPKIEPKAEEGRRELDDIKTIIKEEDQAAKWPKALSLLPSLNASQLNALFANSQLAMSPQRSDGNGEETQAPAPMEIAFILELSGGILIHNQDGLFENFPIPSEMHVQRIKESRPALVDLSTPTSSHLEPLARWRRWRNTLSEGVFVPNPTIMGESGPAEHVNIALTRPEQHDEREKHRSLANKFCLSDAAMAAWRWLNAEATAEMIHRATVGKEKPLKHDDFVRRRADAVGPQRWLHTMKLTLCYLESLLPSGAMCPAWRMIRKDWIEAVLRASSVFELTDLLGRLEASIRQISFLRTWTATMGPLQLDRFTSAQRDEEKRKRALERVAAAANAIPTNLVRTKTVQPVPHTVWKTRGEEYRRLGGDGWQWYSSTRRKVPELTRKPLTDYNLPADRPPYLGLGWGVQSEVLSSAPLNIVPTTTTTLETRKTTSNIHPITGVQISQNVPRTVYCIPTEIIRENSEFFTDGVIDISKCLREGGGRFYPVPMKSVEKEEEFKQPSFHRRRAKFRLDSLLALRQAADKRDKAAAESATIELAALKQEHEELLSRTAEIQSHLAELATKAQEARSEHARAVKARQTAINETKAENGRQLAQSRGGTNPMRRPGVGGGGRRGQQTPAARSNLSVFRPPAAKRVKRDELSNFDSPAVASGAESDESRATSSSKPTSSNAESSGLRRSSRRQKTKNVDPDFVVDFGEDEDEEEEEFVVEKAIGDDEDDDGDVMDVFRSRVGRVPQFDGTADDEGGGSSDEEVENFGVDENNAQNRVKIKIGDAAKVTQLKSVSITPVKTIPITPQVRAASGGANPVGRSLLALAIEGKAPQTITNQPSTNGESGVTESNIRIIQAPASTGGTTMSTNSSQGPMRLVRVLNSTAPSGTSAIRPIAPTTSTAPVSGNLIIPASTDSALQKSLIQLSSSGGVIVTQASQLPAGYRLITPSSLPTAAAGPRQPLNIVHVVPSPQATASQQLFRPRQPSTASSLITIAPSPVLRPQMRPLLPSPFSSGGVAQQRPGLAPRMVRMVTQPMQLDPRLDEAVTEAADKQYEIDMEIFNLRKELRDLEFKSAELKARIQEREDIVSRGTQLTAKRYSLNPMDNSLLKRLNRAAVVRSGNSSEKYIAALQKRYFVHLPTKTPQVNPYAWPPDELYECCVSSSYPQNKQATDKPVPNLFRLSRSSLKSLIRHAGRIEIPGYDAEKKRLTSINWIYPTSRPCFAEAWRYRLRQIIIVDQSAKSACGPLNTPSHYGVSMANLATHLRLLWHSLRWDEIATFAARCEEATLINDRYFLKSIISESHGGGYTLRRIVGVKPLDPYWLRANFLVETTTHKPPIVRKRSAPRSNSTLSTANGGGGEVTKTPGRRGRRPGKGNSKGKADPDYDPAADEGWRVGIPCSARSRRSRRPNYNENSSDLEVDEQEDGMDEDEGENGQEESSNKSDSQKTTLEWTSEENLELWEIRNFFDSILPLDTPYPPSVPRLALEGIPQALVEQLSPVSTTKEDNTKDVAKQPLITKSSEGRWIQPSCLLPPEALRPLSPKPPSPPAPLPPPPNIVVMESTTSQSLVGPSLAPSTPLSPSSSFRPLIVSSNRHPATLPHTAQMGTANRRQPPEFQLMTPSVRSMQQQHQPPSQPRRPNAPLSPNAEAARARARSLAASHAARISAANRRFRNERAAVENRVSALLQEMDNRRRLTVKFLALQVQEEILQSRKPPQPEEPTETIPTPSSSIVTVAVTPQLKGAKRCLRVNKKAIKSEKSELTASATPAGDETLQQVKPPASSRKRVGVGKSPKLTMRRRRASSADSLTPLTEPCTDSDETLLAMKLSPEKKRRKKPLEKKNETVELQSLQPQNSALKRRGGRPINISSRGRGRKRLQASPSSPRSPTNDNGNSSTATAGRRTRGAPKVATSSSTKQRLPIRTPRYLLDEESVKTEQPTSNSLPSSSHVKVTSDTAVAAAATDDGKLYCLCRKPHNPNEAYIGCDLCQDWFHFTCVGLNPDTPPEEIGDSWLCSECRKAEAKAKDEVYCLCRTPYDPARVYIACDRCDEWYHPECVKMKPEDAANLEGSYICPVCSTTKTSSSSKKSSRGRKKRREKQARNDNIVKAEEEVEGGETSSGTIYETPLTEPIKKAVEVILDDLSNHKLAWPIMERLPLNEQAPPLPDPIDLNSFKSSFENGEYKSLGDVSFAGNRLFSNARSAFEVGSNALHCVEVLESFFVHRMKEVRALTEQHQQQGPSSS